MKKTVLLLAVLGLANTIQAQNLQLPSASEIANLPQWAQEMYGNNPNLHRVEQSYRSYYRNHSFQKNYHTQYYKRWRRRVINFADENGIIRLPSAQEQAAITEAYLRKQSNSRSSNWSLVGPVQVLNNNGTPGSTQTNVYSIDQCAADLNIMYCGTEPGEVYKSSNAGNTWTNVSLNENFGSGVTAVEVNPGNGNIVFAGGNAGVFRSTNGGSTWTNVLPNTNFGVNELLVNPSNTQIVLAATDKGLYRSTDGGDNWTQLYSDNAYDVKHNPANSDTVYLVKNNPTLDICEFWRSGDAGATWALQSNGWYSSTDPARNDGGARLGVSPANPNRVYAYLIGEAKANDYGFIGVYRSDDSGATWTLPNTPAGGPYSTSHPNLAYGYPNWTYHQGFYNCALMVSPTNADQILIGGLNLWRSNDGGATFSSVAGYVGGPLDLHVDMQDFRAIGSDIWVTTDGGIYHSTDFFNTQPEFKMFGVHGSDYWGFGSGWNEDVLVGGLYHNGNIAHHENYGYGYYLELGGGEAPTGYVNPGNSRKTYFSDIGGRYIPLSITDPITTFSVGKSPNESYYAAESSEMEFHPHCYNIAFIGNENKLWKTVDGGASYNLVYTFGSSVDDQIKYIEISSSNPDVIYLNQQPSGGGSGTLWKSTDGGNSWSSLSIPAGNSRRMLLSINPANHNELWIAYPSGSNGNKVFKTVNGGSAWSNITTAALDNESVQSITHIAGTDGGIYVCTNYAVYYGNNTTALQLDNSGLPLYFSSNIARPFYRDGKIRIASYGKGIWESDLTEQPSEPVARITVDKLEQTVICALDSFYFEDYSCLNHAGATWQWAFQGGSPATSSQRNPVVYFDTAGTYLVTLLVTDGNGAQDSDSLYITVSNYTLPTDVTEGFEASFLPSGWTAYSQAGGGQWSLSTDAGGYGNSAQSAVFNNYDIDATGNYSDMRLNFDASVTGLTELKLHFDVAYAEYGGQYTDTLEVLVSDDCGQTFTQLYRKGGDSLATASDNSNYFIPAAGEWRTDTVDLSPYIGTANLLVAFRNYGHWGNVIYVDNVNLDTTMTIISSAAPAPLQPTDVAVYPNPAQAGACLYLTLPNEKTTVALYDLNGKLVKKAILSGFSSFDLPENLPAAMYLLNIKTDTRIWNKSVVVVPRN